MAIKRDEKVEARKFGVILFIALALIGGYFWWKGRMTGAAISAGTGAVILLVDFALPSVWLAFFRLWMKFAEKLGFVMTRVILSVFFFLILTPVGLIMRLIGKTPLDLKFRDGRTTYWVDKPEVESTVERYSKQF